MALISAVVLLVLAGGSTQAADPGLSEILPQGRSVRRQLRRKDLWHRWRREVIAARAARGDGIRYAEASGRGNRAHTHACRLDRTARRRRDQWQTVEGRKNRFERVLLEMTVSEEELFRIANESARFSIGPRTGT